VAYCVDENSNGLSDVWEQLYDASSLVLLNDDDGDGFNNLEECEAGTDPYDNKDRPQLKTFVGQENIDEIELTFKTLTGKNYTLFHSTDLSSFDPIGTWLGDSNERSLLVNTNGLSESLSPIRLDFWADLPSATIDALYALDRFPTPPDGSINTTAPEAPAFQATGYGARLTTRITPPQTGSYTFYLSAGGPAELYLATDTAALSKIAEIFPAQAGIPLGTWELYPTQRADALDLTAGEDCFLDLRYVSAIAGQHVQIAWSGPGLSGIEPLDRSSLAKTLFHDQTSDEVVLLEHDYDSLDQTGKLWGNSTGIESNVVGLSGNAERITADLGSSTEERLNFSQGGHDHLYTTWLFNMSAGVQDTYLYFQNGSMTGQEGPRIDIEDSTSGTLAVVRAGGSGGSDAQINIEFDKSFRIELIATLAAGGFAYKTPTGTYNVTEDTFDIYVSDPAGNLIGSATGLAFRDGPGVVEALSSLRLPNPNTPNSLR